MFLHEGKTGVRILPAVVILMLLAGLFPLDFKAPNDVIWLEGGPGLGFSGRGIILGGTGAPLPVVSPAEEQALSLEIVLKPAFLPASSLRHILSFADGRGKERLFFGQWKGSVVLREVDRTGLLTETVTRIGSPEILDPSRKTVFTLAAGDGKTSLYADGEPVFERVDLDMARELAGASAGHLVFGNRPAGNNPWEGDLYGFSLLRGSLSPGETARRAECWKKGEAAGLHDGQAVLLYLFDEGGGRTVRNRGTAAGWDLEIPRTLSPLEREILALPPSEALVKGWFYTDALVNLAGFVPFGLLVSLSLPRRLRTGRRIRTTRVHPSVLPGGSRRSESEEARGENSPQNSPG